MLNGELTMECAEQLRDQALNAQLQDAQSTAEVVDSLLERVLGRRASEAEQRWLAEHLESTDSTFPEALLEACVAILNTNEFLYVD